MDDHAPPDAFASSLGKSGSTLIKIVEVGFPNLHLSISPHCRFDLATFTRGCTSVSAQRGGFPSTTRTGRSPSPRRRRSATRSS